MDTDDKKRRKKNFLTSSFDPLFDKHKGKQKEAQKKVLLFPLPLLVWAVWRVF